VKKRKKGKGKERNNLVLIFCCPSNPSALEAALEKTRRAVGTDEKEDDDDEWK
jgi:hypothetical protein